MRIVLVDDHALFRAGLASLLRAWGLQVIGQAANGREAIALAGQLIPDVIFMDINMPSPNGLETTRAIKAAHPEIKVIVLTVSDDEQDLFEAIKSGAEGYLLKNLREEEFADLVGRIGRGEPVMSPGLAKRLLQEFARLRQDQRRSEIETVLTDREREILEYVARGATNREIAGSLFISENTVNYHMKNMLGKLHLRNRAQVVAWAMERGFVARPEGPVRSPGTQ
ncbi:MAG: response regulator transcription factor [Chloroflexi bacterium]|nr:response regulator transcription factor [Chloroflexota bacterium]